MQLFRDFNDGEFFPRLAKSCREMSRLFVGFEATLPRLLMANFLLNFINASREAIKRATASSSCRLKLVVSQKTYHVIALHIFLSLSLSLINNRSRIFWKLISYLGHTNGGKLFVFTSDFIASERK